MKFKNPKLIISGVLLIFISLLGGMFLINPASKESYNTDRSYKPLIMSDQKYEQMRNDMYAVCLPELVYADEDRVVLHLIDGIFVYNVKVMTMENKCDISELNCLKNSQGSSILSIQVSTDGKKALLVNTGPEDEIAGYDNYYINLDTGTYEKTKDKSMEDYFDNYVTDKHGYRKFPTVAKVGDKRISCVCNDSTRAEPLSKHKLVIKEKGKTIEKFIFE